MRIGNDILEVNSWGQYALNNVDKADLDDPEATLSGFKIVHSNPDVKHHTFDIVREDKKYITIRVFKDIVALNIPQSVDPDAYKNSVGLLGSVEGQMLARDGVTLMTDPNKFGQEWQVHDDEPMLFRVVREPQYPMEQCRLPSVEASAERRRLGQPRVTKLEAEDVCAHLNGEELINCVFDGEQIET